MRCGAVHSVKFPYIKYSNANLLQCNLVSNALVDFLGQHAEPYRVAVPETSPLPECAVERIGGGVL